MQIAGTQLQGYYIEELPPVADPSAELPGALFEVETKTGPNDSRENKKLTAEQLLAFLSDMLGGGGGVFTSDITVSLAGGRTFGRFQNGQIIPAAGKTATEVILLAAVEDIFPSYTPASVSVSQSAPADGEVGESLANTITGVFNQNDAGPVTAMRLYRVNQAQIGASSTSSPTTRTVQMVRSLTPTGIWAVADYAAGPIKTVAPGNTPDPRTPAVRNPNAPQAAEVGLSSSIIYYTGYYRVFRGPFSGALTTSDAVRALPSVLTNQGTVGILETGTTQKDFAIILPPGNTLKSVFDLDNQGANITAAYVQKGTISVKDAGGNAHDHPAYIYNAAGPYPANARHQYTYGI